MGFLFGKKKTISTTENKLGALRIQSSTQGLPIPIVYGKTRITANLLWRDDFTAIPQTETQTSGGKGGGETTSSSTSYTYTVALVMGLMEGPSVSGSSFIGTVWASKAITDPVTLGLTQFEGSYSQSPWSYLTTNHPDNALAYRGLAYAATGAFDLGGSDSPPNLSFEVTGFLAGADVNPAAVLSSLLTNDTFGAGWPAAQLSDLTDFDAYCGQANFLISPAYTAQRPMADMLSELAKIGNSAPVWSDNTLKIIPYADTSVGSYTPDLTVRYNLTDDDFLAGPGEDPVRVIRKRQADAFNQVQIECLDRTNAYNTAIVEAKDQANIDLFGLRPLELIQAHAICDLEVGRTVAQTILQRELYIRNTYEFTVGWRYAMLEPMDVVTLTESRLGLSAATVRITSIDEDEDGGLRMTAEDLNIGVSTPGSYSTQTSSGTAPNNEIAPGDTNTPVLFQPPLALSGTPQIWLGASGGPEWGGCQVWASSDGGSSYRQVGTITNPATYGELTGNFPSSVDPDTANTLAVDLSESNGSITAVSTSVANSGGSLSYVGAAGSFGELVAFSSANLTAPYTYDLDTFIRRGRYGTEPAAHTTGQKFLQLDGAIGKIDISKAQFNTTVYIKLLSFNRTGGAIQNLADVSPHTFAAQYQLVTNGFGYPFIVDAVSQAATDPGAGKMRFNSATQNASTQLYFSTAAGDGGNMSTFFASAGNLGVLEMRDPADSAKWATFTFNGANAGSGFHTFNVAFQSGGYPFPNLDVVELAIKPTGVTGVGLVMPAAVFTVANSPVTTTGNLTVTFVTQNAGVVFAGPLSGNAATPTFRNLAGADFGAQNAALVLAGPSSGNAANASFRALVASDLGSQNASAFLAGPSSGNAANAAFRSIAGGDLPKLTINSQTANYTLALSDANVAYVTMSNTANLVVTVPSEANVAFANGTSVLINRANSGTVTISPEANVTVNNALSNTLRAQNSVAALVKRGTNLWDLFGDLT